jgi:metal-responsive CopG/Arc/MetJ family transcriptional regulator
MIIQPIGWEMTKRAARMTIELPPKIREKLEKLAKQKETNLSEIIRDAIQVYDFLQTQTSKYNNKIILRNSKGDQEVIITNFY